MNPISINIRRAVESDCQKILELIQELAEYERCPNEVTLTLAEFKQDGFGTKPVWKAFVAESAVRIEGFALYYIRYSTWKGQRLYLEDILVTQDMRGKGIGKALFNRILVEAKDGGFNGMNWQVLDWNTPAINFYNKYAAHIDSEWLNGSLSREKILLLTEK